MALKLKLAEVFPPYPTPLWTLAKQVGVTHAVTGCGWRRTPRSGPGRGGALVTGYVHALMREAPPTEWGEITEEQLWDNMADFLKRVVPVAEKAKVRLAVHPDDPPLSPIRGIG